MAAIVVVLDEEGMVYYNNTIGIADLIENEERDETPMDGVFNAIVRANTKEEGHWIGSEDSA